MNKKAKAALHKLRAAKANGALDSTEVEFLTLIEGLLPESGAKMCPECGGAPVEVNGVCVGCNAYREHTGAG